MSSSSSQPPPTPPPPPPPSGPRAPATLREKRAATTIQRAWRATRPANAVPIEAFDYSLPSVVRAELESTTSWSEVIETIAKTENGECSNGVVFVKLRKGTFRFVMHSNQRSIDNQQQQQFRTFYYGSERK